MKKKLPFQWFWKGDRPMLGAWIIVDLFLLLVARNYFQSVNELSIEAIYRSPAEADFSSIVDLQKIASRGSWDTFEKARLETVAQYLQSNSRPSSGNALYFYPETLPDRSLEKYFATSALKPRLEALRKARRTKKKVEITHAYQLLKSRVLSYELGASADPESLSDEAKKFLDLYSEFTKLNR